MKSWTMEDGKTLNIVQVAAILAGMVLLVGGTVALFVAVLVEKCS